MYKNLLQELTQKEGSPLPVYTTTRSGEAHSSMFVSSVEVKGEVFSGERAKTKKQAEFLAAKVAYMKLKECMCSKPIRIRFIFSEKQKEEKRKSLFNHSVDWIINVLMGLGAYRSVISL